MFPMRTRVGLAGAKAPAALLLCTIVLGLALAASANAGPWTQTRNGYFTTARLSWLSTSKFYDADGNVVDTSTLFKYTARTVQFDTEYGVSNHLTFMLGMPVQFLAYKLTAGNPDKFSNNGFGDLNFGFKYGLLNPAGRAAVALEIDANTPTGYNSQGLGRPPMGRGKFSTFGRLHAGTTFDPAPVYVQAEVGYRRFFAKRDSTPAITEANGKVREVPPGPYPLVSSALVYGVEAGAFVSPRMLIVGEFHAEKSLDYTKTYFQDLSEAGALVQYRLKPHLDVMAGMSTSLSGKNATKGTRVRLGVTLKGNGLGRYRGQTAAGYSEGAFPGAAKAMAPAPVPVPEPVSIPTPAASDSSSTPDQPK